LLAGDGGADFRGLRVDLRDVFAVDDDFLSNPRDLQLYVNAGFFGDVEDDALGDEFLEAGGRDGEIVGGAGKSGNGVGAVSVGLGLAREVAANGGDDDFGAGDSGSGLVGDPCRRCSRYLRTSGEGMPRTSSKAQMRKSNAEVMRVPREVGILLAFTMKPREFLKRSRRTKGRT